MVLRPKFPRNYTEKRRLLAPHPTEPPPPNPALHSPNTHPTLNPASYAQPSPTRQPLPLLSPFPSLILFSGSKGTGGKSREHADLRRIAVF